MGQFAQLGLESESLDKDSKNLIRFWKNLILEGELLINDLPITPVLNCLFLYLYKKFIFIYIYIHTIQTLTKCFNKENDSSYSTPPFTENPH
jgi:hypothetical protein